MVLPPEGTHRGPRQDRRAERASIMDYKAAGAPKKGSNAPRHKEHNAPGPQKNPFGKRPTKEELVARLKAKAQAPKKA